MPNSMKLVIGAMTPIGDPNNFLVGKVTASVPEQLGDRDIFQTIELTIRVPYHATSSLQELQESLRAKALEILDEITLANRK